MKINKIEKMARCYVEHCGDEAAAMRAASPQIADRGNSELKTMFNSLYSKSPTFWRRVAELQKNVETQIGVKANDVLNRIAAIAYANVTELTRVVAVNVPCKKCGLVPGRIGHPDPDCPYCLGMGLISHEVHTTPTEQLSEFAQHMYDGAEMTKHGIKVKHLDRDKAYDRLCRAMGLLGGGPDGGSKAPEAPEDTELPELPKDPVEAARIYHEWIKKK